MLGPRPAMAPVASETPNAYITTRRSMNSSETPSRSEGATARSASRLPRASARPSAPPAPASSRLSTSSVRAIAQRPAPSEARIAISRWRDADRRIVGKASDDVEDSPLCLTPGAVAIELRGGPQVDILLHEAKTGGHHAYDLARLSGQLHPSTDGTRVAAQQVLPGAVADHGG